jgi:DNA-binding response OmpR family regulator
MGGTAGSSTVLVVDDDASLRLLCRVNLELEGLRVLEAGDVAEAEALLATETVDLLLLDVHIGVDSGVDLMRSVRERGGAPPIVLVTGSVELDSKTQAEADGVVPKPFRLDELIGVVRRLVGRDDDALG